jgi:putative transposase
VARFLGERSTSTSSTTTTEKAWPKPTQNAYIERFNRTARHEWLDMHLFHSVAQAQLLATQWLWSYNNERPNTAIGGVPPRWLLRAA